MGKSGICRYLFTLYINLGVRVRLIQDLFIGFTRDLIRDFGNCPLNTGCSLNAGPLNTGCSLDAGPLNTGLTTHVFFVHSGIFNCSFVSFEICIGNRIGPRKIKA